MVLSLFKNKSIRKSEEPHRDWHTFPYVWAYPFKTFSRVSLPLDSHVNAKKSIRSFIYFWRYDRQSNPVTKISENNKIRQDICNTPYWFKYPNLLLYNTPYLFKYPNLLLYNTPYRFKYPNLLLYNTPYWFKYPNFLLYNTPYWFK